MSLQALLGIDIPIIQAPMAGAQDSALAIAVCQTGGLGSLPCAMLSPETIRSEVARIRAQTTRPFNLNFFCHPAREATEAQLQQWRARFAPYYAQWNLPAPALQTTSTRKPFDAEFAEIVLALRPAVVSFHFGLPEDALLSRVRDSGARVLSSATTVEEARWLEARGVDAIIAQGLEAGGHRGMFLHDDIRTQIGTLALLPQVVHAVNVPVIAAGGIADAQGVRAVLALGAAAAQVGTAYLLCPESTTSAVHRAALRSDAASHTALTNVFTGRPARGIVNRMMRELGPMHPNVPPFPLATFASSPLRTAAENAGSDDFSPLWAGQNVSGCREVRAAELTRSLAGQ